MTSQEKSDSKNLSNFSKKNEEEFNKQQEDRRAKYNKMIAHLSQYDDWEKHKFLIPPFVELTYEDYRAEEEYRRTGKYKAQQKEAQHIDKPTENDYIVLD